MKHVLASVLWLLLPVAAHACPVCGSATEQNRIAFLITTALLSFLPLVLIGAGVLYLRRRYRQLEEDAAGEVQPAAGSASQGPAIPAPTVATQHTA